MYQTMCISLRERPARQTCRWQTMCISLMERPARQTFRCIKPCVSAWWKCPSERGFRIISPQWTNVMTTNGCQFFIHFFFSGIFLVPGGGGGERVISGINCLNDLEERWEGTVYSVQCIYTWNSTEYIYRALQSTSYTKSLWVTSTSSLTSHTDRTAVSKCNTDLKIDNIFFPFSWSSY